MSEDIAGSVAREVSAKMDGTAREIISVITRFLEQRMKAARGKAEYLRSRELLDYIKDGGSLLPYSPRGGGETALALKRRLEIENIPYVPDTKTGMIMIRDYDYDRVAELNREVLVAKGNYYQECTMDELAESMKYSKNKKVIEFDGVDAFDAKVIKNKCNSITKGFMVASEENADGTYRLAVDAKYVYDAKGGNDVCHSILQAALSLHMANEDIKKAQMIHDANIEEKARSLTGCKEPHYIIDGVKRDRYIEINEDGFIFKTVKNGKEKVIKSVSVNDPEYDSMLKFSMDHINDKMIVKDLSATSSIDGDERPLKNNKEILNSKAYSEIAAKMDAMIKGKLGDMEPEKAAKRYFKEVDKIMDGVRDGKVPTGYSKEDMDKLSDFCKNNGVKASEVKEAVSKETSLITGIKELEKVASKEEKAQEKEEEREM